MFSALQHERTTFGVGDGREQEYNQEQEGVAVMAGAVVVNSPLCHTHRFIHLVHGGCDPDLREITFICWTGIIFISSEDPLPLQWSDQASRWSFSVGLFPYAQSIAERTLHQSCPRSVQEACIVATTIPGAPSPLSLLSSHSLSSWDVLYGESFYRSFVRDT